MPPSGAGSVRSEHRNVDILIPIARQRESRACPHVPCERRTVPAEPATTPSGGTITTMPRDGLGYAAFLQNAPVVRHTRGFTPGWYAVPRWGTPNPSPSCEPSRAPTKRQRDRAGASIGTSTS